MHSLKLAAALLCCLAAVPAAARDFVATEADFACLLEWKAVGNVRIHHDKPRLQRKAIRVLESNKPNRRYPVGTIIQLVPFEAMVKRPNRFNPDGNGWEFFQLGVSPAGTTIVSRGGDAINFVGLACKNCHAKAARFDFVCGKAHGCDPIPLTDAAIQGLQQGDPRCTDR